tara:strand:+ start:236 stop:505 length:270 start_codon:yes stop_codon:yes gene_type:complete
MTGFLYFLGNTLRWPALKPKEFLSLHGYLLVIYFITFALSQNGVSLANLIFTVGILAPLLIAIGQGLPLNCLDFKSSLIKELESESINL